MCSNQFAVAPGLYIERADVCLDARDPLDRALVSLFGRDRAAKIKLYATRHASARLSYEDALIEAVRAAIGGSR